MTTHETGRVLHVMASGARGGGGRWYVRTIHMVETTDEADVDYESNWATLTFQVR